MKKYFKYIFVVVTSLAKSFAITSKNIFGGFSRKSKVFTHIYHPAKNELLEKPVEVNFPDIDKKTGKISFPEENCAAENFNSNAASGIHILEIADCNLCKSCQEVCPVDCIEIIGEIKGKAKSKEYSIGKFTIDYSQCMFCGLCTEMCPTNCLKHSQNWDYSSYFSESLVKDMLTDKVFCEPLSDNEKASQV